MIRCLLHPPPTPCLLRIYIFRRPWNPMFFSAILQSFWEALPTNDWRGVTHPLENILFNNNNCENLTNFRTGPTVTGHLPLALDHDQIYVVSEDTTAKSPSDLSLDPRARQPQFPHCFVVASHTGVFSWYSSLRRFPAINSLPFSKSCPNVTKKPTSTTPRGVSSSTARS